MHFPLTFRGERLHPSFSLAPGQAQILDIPAAGSATIGVVFDATSSNAPTTRTGAVDYQSNDPNQLAGTIPLSGSI